LRAHDHVTVPLHAALPISAFIAFRRDGIRRFWSGLVPPLALLAIVFGLIMLQPDFGTGVTIVGAVVIMLFASGAHLGQLIGIGLDRKSTRLNSSHVNISYA